MGNSINPDFTNIDKIREQQITQAAFQRGDVGKKAKEIDKELETPQDRMVSILKSEELSEGKLRTFLSDGRTITQAPNGVIKEEEADGTMKISMPNGILVQRDACGKVMAYDPTPGKFLEVEQFQETPTSQYKFKFKDSDGNNVLLTSNTLRFEITNPTKTLHEKVHASGSVNIDTNTLFRDPKTGKFHADKGHVYVETDGDVHKYGNHLSDMHVSRHGVKFNEHNDLHTRIDFPYTIPYKINEPGHHHPAPHPQPPQEPQPPQQPGTPVPGYPFPVPPTYPGDPYAPVMTPSGLIRQQSPDGSLFLSLPNGIVLHQGADGKAEAYDARNPNAVYPAVVKDVIHPGVGAEKEYIFPDAAGNTYKAFSKSLDFLATNKDKNVNEVVHPAGNIMVFAKTKHNDSNGHPYVKYHKLEVLPNGYVNTFGEKGVYMTNGTVSFTEHGKIQTLPLAYPVPQFQGFLDSLKGVNPPYPTKPESGETPAFPGRPVEAPPQAPVKKGIWQKVKEFFTGDPGAQRVNPSPYPMQGYGYNPNQGMGTVMALTAFTGLTTALSMLPLMSYPGGYYYYPMMPPVMF